MIMHVLNPGIRFDFMVGSQIDGYDTMVGLSDDSQIAVLEGDEYLTSAIDRRPKFHLYMPDIAILNGIAWDHMNVFPTFENYVEQFRIFAGKISPGGALIYFADDTEVKKIADEASGNIRKIPYRVHGHFQNKKGFFAATHNRTLPLLVFGEHNMQNLSAAKEACLASGITEDDFYNSIQASPELQRGCNDLSRMKMEQLFSISAHSPSKVKATIEAVAEISAEPDSLLRTAYLFKPEF
jgi:UDP-N-acetylmuramate: L-alanyl-gamma-D-glutamyl-meso-diaminopimelate ligase